MQFRVPQFLDIEDKIFGPFTFSQFVYMAGGAGLVYVLYKWLGLLVGIIPIIFVIVFSLMLAFYKPNGKPFADMLQSAFIFAFQYRLYIWQRRKVKKSKEPENNKQKMEEALALEDRKHKLTGSKLRDLAWSLDILDTKRENNEL